MGRPTLIYSSKSSSSSVKPQTGYSRGSSRASTPPSTPYYQSLDVDPIATLRTLAREDSPSGRVEQQQQQRRRQGQTSSISSHHTTARKRSPQSQAWRLKRPSKASILHYVSLVLSVRLLFHTHKLSLLLLTMVLAITLEGRAKIEKLGLRGTMTATLAVVCVGLGLGNLSVGDGWSGAASGIWTSEGNCRGDMGQGNADPTLIFTGNISSGAEAGDIHSGHPNAAPLLTVSVCTAAPIERRRELGDHRLLHAAKTHFIGSSQQSVSTSELCRCASEELDVASRRSGGITASGKRVFQVRIAVEPTSDIGAGAFALDSVTTCIF